MSCTSCKEEGGEEDILVCSPYASSLKALLSHLFLFVSFPSLSYSFLSSSHIHSWWRRGLWWREGKKNRLHRHCSLFLLPFSCPFLQQERGKREKAQKNQSETPGKRNEKKKKKQADEDKRVADSNIFFLLIQVQQQKEIQWKDKVCCLFLFLGVSWERMIRQYCYSVLQQHVTCEQASEQATELSSRMTLSLSLSRSNKMCTCLSLTTNPSV